MFICLAVVFACTPGSDLPVLGAANTNQGYRLGPNDKIRVITYGEQGLSGEFGIDDNGFIAVPLLGSIHAEGMTAADLAKQLQATMQARKLFAEPSVVVEVTKYRPVYVLGEVQHPGPFPYEAHMTFLQAVALAGGFTPRAVKSTCEVIRTTQAGSQRGRLEPTGHVEPGDVITVLERNF